MTLFVPEQKLLNDRFNMFLEYMDRLYLVYVRRGVDAEGLDSLSSDIIAAFFRDNPHATECLSMVAIPREACPWEKEVVRSSFSSFASLIRSIGSKPFELVGPVKDLGSPYCGLNAFGQIETLAKDYAVWRLCFMRPMFGMDVVAKFGQHLAKEHSDILLTEEAIAEVVKAGYFIRFDGVSPGKPKDKGYSYQRIDEILADI